MSSTAKPDPASKQSRLGQGWCMPSTIRRFGGKLLSQQLWCWGRDISYPEGNLLMRFGFERHRDCNTEARSTCYRLDQDGMHVALWGFGMFFGLRELGGLYLGRFQFCPDWAPIESIALSIHWPDQLPVFDRPNGQEQWQRARLLWELQLKWIAEYEHWVVDTSGIAYRNDCVDTWLRPFVQAERMSDAWRFLSVRGWEEKDQDQPLNQKLKNFTLFESP